MRAKILLLALSATAFGSCSTAYKSGQTPDDVYYSPARAVPVKQNTDRDEVRNTNNQDYTILMRTRDYRWREFDDAYNFENSPYNYCTCACANYGYYYNPFYHPWPVYTKQIIPINNTPRMVNLNSYTGYNNNAIVGPKSGIGINWVKPSAQYNNSNRSGFGNVIRQVFSPSGSSGRSASSNNSRTYSPSSGSGGSGKVSRPGRG